MLECVKYSHVRFSVRRMMILVATLAVAIALIWWYSAWYAFGAYYRAAMGGG
jgi:hypothetical protein